MKWWHFDPKIARIWTTGIATAKELINSTGIHSWNTCTWFPSIEKLNMFRQRSSTFPGISCNELMKCLTVQQHWIFFQGTCDKFLRKSIHRRAIEQKSSQALQHLDKYDTGDKSAWESSVQVPLECTWKFTSKIERGKKSWKRPW